MLPLHPQRSPVPTTLITLPGVGVTIGHLLQVPLLWRQLEERPCVNCYPGRRGKCAPSNLPLMLSSYLHHRHNQRLFFNPIAHILSPANRDHFHSLPCLGHLRLRVSPLSRMNRLAMLLGHSLSTPPLWRLPLMFRCLHTPHFHQWFSHSHV